MEDGTSNSSGSATSGGYNPLYDPATDNQPIESHVQELINKPPTDDTGFNEGDEAFIKDVVQKFEEGVINRHSPSSLLNEEIYEALDDAGKGKADQNAFNILTSLRNIYDLWKIQPEPTFQIQNQIHHVRMTKERLEADLGDVYIV
ncbi:MAG: hypothetical protein Q8P27_01440 [Candidatus Peregrinibacteria bacterium]|nr:hypothetical protein [Candidatus Peregrinibacteria bacterium]